MARKEKILEKVRNNVKNTSLVDYEGLINAFGKIKEGTKHPQAIIGNMNMTYKRENPVKPAYVRGLLKMIDSQMGR